MNAIKVIIGFVAGVIVGGVASYIYTERKLSKEFEADLEDYKVRTGKVSEESAETEKDVKDVKPKRGPKSKEELDREANEMAKEIREEMHKDAVEAARRMQEGVKKSSIARSNNSKTNYNSVSTGENKPLNESAMEKLNGPVMVTEEEYDDIKWEEMGYDIKSWMYNRESNTLYDEKGDVVEDDDLWVGLQNLDKMYDGECTIFIRNDNMKAMIMVDNDEYV